MAAGHLASRRMIVRPCKRQPPRVLERKRIILSDNLQSWSDREPRSAIAPTTRAQRHEREREREREMTGNGQAARKEPAS